MKSTANRGYPYPECDPPLVKDVADLPGQLKALATAVDADLTAVQSAATASLNPAGVDLQRTTAQVLVPGQAVNVDTTRFATGGVAIDLVTGAFTVPAGAAGLWLLTGAVSAASGPTVFHNLSLRVNGAIVRTSTLNPNAVGGDPIDNAVHAYPVLQAGDTVSMVQNFTGAANISYGFAHLSGVLVAKFS